MTSQQKTNKEPLITYAASEISTGKIIATGNDFSKVHKIAESSGLKFKISFIPNPKLAFVF